MSSSHRGTWSLVDNKHGRSSATAGRRDSNLHSSVFEVVVVFPQPDVAAHIAFRLIAPVTVEHVKNLLENTGVLRGEGNAALLFPFRLHVLSAAWGSVAFDMSPALGRFSARTPVA